MNESRKRRGRYEGSIIQLPNGRWVAQLSLGHDGNGKRIRKRVYGATKQDALTALKELQALADRHALPDSSRLTVSQFLDKWLEAIEPSLARGTFYFYSRHVANALKPKLGGVQLSKLSSFHVDGLYRSLAEDGASVAMQRHAGATLRSALTWAVRKKLLPDNPAKVAAMPSPAHHEVKAIEPDQLVAFLNAAKSDRYFALYALAVDSGCRQGEVLALTWADIDFSRSTIQVTKSLEEIGGSMAIKAPKTKKARRPIAVSDFTIAALQDHRKAMLAEGSCRPDAPVFCGIRSRTWLRKSDLYRHSFKPILDAAGVTFRFHDLRHACASMLLMAGQDIKTVQERLGHSTPTMTMNVYAHVIAGGQVDAARKLGAILSASAAKKVV